MKRSRLSSQSFFPGASRISHKELIQFANNHNFKLPTHGVCWGIHAMACIFAAKGIPVIPEISQFSRLKMLPENEALPQELQERLKELEIHQDPRLSSIDKKIGFSGYRQCVEQSSQLLPTPQPIESLDSFCSVYSYEELCDYFLLMKQTYEKTKTPFSLSLSDGLHAISIHYEVKTGNWVLIDANQLPGRLCQSIDEITKAAAGALCAAPGTAIFSTTILCTPEHKKNISPALTDAQNTSTWQAMHKVTQEKVQKHTNRGVDQLFVASSFGHTRTVRSLIQAKSCINRPTVTKKTPLHNAARNGFDDIVTTLINAGADFKAIDSLDYTPDQIAKQFGFKSTAELVLKLAEEKEMENYRKINRRSSA